VADVVRFRGELWLHQGQAAWHFVTLPGEVADDVGHLSAGVERGFGSVRVEATIGATTWSTSLFPDTASRSYVLPVKKAVRSAERLQAGDPVEVALVLVDDR
jgi:hypothetical protein